MSPVYFDTSVFLAIFNAEAEARKIRELLAELRRDKVRIYTSIITVQEVSVLSFRNGELVTDNHVHVNKIARIESITKEIALTAAKLEAGIIDSGGPVENKRRKWDCFHLATAISLRAATFYALDDKFQTRVRQLSLTLRVEQPLPRKPPLDFGAPASAVPRPQP